ncbi:MAG TPA: cyclic nucleotide-binding domain-containing protein, partial [Thermoanaerobaculia bacterium]|nr:cyclic nucleotide-binding domain-containing protein [Thermoanaerobaculia bacterium]
MNELYQELLPLGREGVVPAGDELWQEGAKGDNVVLLVEGTFEVLQSSPSGEPIVLRLARAGDVLGEMACLDGGARSAGLRAATDCRIRTIPAAEFRDFIRLRPHLMEELFRIESQRIRSLSRMVSQSQHRAITDRLTSLYNYGFFIERLDLELERA